MPLKRVFRDDNANGGTIWFLSLELRRKKLNCGSLRIVNKIVLDDLQEWNETWVKYGSTASGYEIMGRFYGS